MKYKIRHIDLVMNMCFTKCGSNIYDYLFGRVSKHLLVQIILLLYAFCAVISVHLIEIFMHIFPCKLCTYQRYVCYSAIILSVTFFIAHFLSYSEKHSWKMSSFIKAIPPKCLCRVGNFSSIFLISLNVGISVFHVGIENRWWIYNSGCSGNFMRANSLEEYAELLNKADIVPCNIIQREILGLSLAGWNCIYSILALMVVIFVLNQKFVSRCRGFS